VFTTPDGRLVVVTVGAALTVSVVLPFTAPRAARIVLLPLACAVASPPLVIVATVEDEDVHTTSAVMFLVLPSL
jgi:hypothetical protein